MPNGKDERGDSFWLGNPSSEGSLHFFTLVVSDQTLVDHQQGWVEQMQLNERSVSVRYATSSLSVETAMGQATWDPTFTRKPQTKQEQEVGMFTKSGSQE